MTQLTVFVIDEDKISRDSLQSLLESVEIQVETYESADSFFSNYQNDQRGCLVVDVQASGIECVEFLRKLPDAGIDLPVIFVTDHNDTSMAIDVMKHGAVDYIKKPYNPQLLLDSVQNILLNEQQRSHTFNRRLALSMNFEILTPREREVMLLVVRGMANKVIAEVLQISPKTIEVHRARVMEKMSAKSLPELIQMAITLGVLDLYIDEQEFLDEPSVCSGVSQTQVTLTHRVGYIQPAIEHGVR